MAKEYFWGAKLSEDQKTVTWDPDADMHDDEDEDDDDAIEHFLFLKQAVLGVEAKEGKRNIIEIETTNFDGETVCQPLVSLKLGLNESVCLDIGLQPPVTFKLAAGSGPVFLSGQHALDLQENEDFREFREEDEDEDLEDLDADESIVDVTPDLRKVIKGKAAAKVAKAAKKPAEDEDEDDEDEEEEEEEEVKVAKGKKRPAPSAGGSAKKLAKTTEKDGTSIKRTITNGNVENGVAGEEHDDDDDEEEDEDYKVEEEEEEDASEEEEEDEEMALGAGESDDEEESDEDEEDMEGEEDDEEEDDDEEDEKEEEEEESSPDKSPKKTKGKVNGVKKAEPAKVQGKTKGQKEKKKAFSTDEIKKSIMQSPSKPKKEEKFKNFVKARFHVTEPKKIQELWGWFKSTQLK